MARWGGFGLGSGIDFEPTGHDGLWDDEAVWRILVFEAEGVSSWLRFSVAIEASVAAPLGAEAVRARLKAELAGDLEQRLPEALGMVVTETGKASRPQSAGKPGFAWHEDALRRIGYHSLAPHDLVRLGDKRAASSEHWRRVVR